MTAALFVFATAPLSTACDDARYGDRAAPGARSSEAPDKAPTSHFPAATQSARSTAPSSPSLSYLSFELGGARTDDTLPLLIAIHGLGDSPENFSHWLRGLDIKLRLIVPRAPTSYGHGYSWFPYRADRAEHELAEGIARSRDLLERLVDDLLGKFGSSDKPAVLGFSQGGMLSFALAAHAPERFSLVMPLGGLLPGELDPPPIAAPQSRPELLAFHGTDDRIVPFADAKRATERLSALGYDVHLHSYPGVGHQIPPDMRAAVFAKLREWAAR
ncbi:MAG: alpha/beta fold hydrolase [Polyangiaceae bacterium]|nr:alpha/beta fold hydrolase [Myxococcales bacterium]MCB9587213.1 alpha/beta fold hydrolase [Polyangiaceae bacterium]